MISKQHIITLIRKRLGLKRGEYFKFANQKSETNMYYFTRTNVMKVVHGKKRVFEYPSSVSLNHLLSDECEIVKCPVKLSEC